MNHKVQDSRRELVERIIKQLSDGKLVWKMGWVSMSRPYNPVSQLHYQAGNRIRLIYATQINGYQDYRWCTYNQAKKEGWNVKKGETGVLCEKWIFTKQEEVKNPNTGEKEKRTVRLKQPYVNYFYVFNGEQIEGIPEFERNPPKTPDQNLKLAERIVKSSSCPVYSDGGDRAFYRPGTDTIHVPDAISFLNYEEYLSTILHEMAHSTGHESRLNRNIKYLFSDQEYAREELVAELAAVFVRSDFGLTLTDSSLENNSAYIQHWIQLLSKDPDALFAAASAAEQASSWLEKQYALYYDLEIEQLEKEPKESANHFEREGQEQMAQEKNPIGAKPAPTELAERIVDFLENNDPAFGYAESFEGQGNKEQWIRTITGQLLQNRATDYITALQELLEGKPEIREETDSLIREMRIYMGEIPDTMIREVNQIPVTEIATLDFVKIPTEEPGLWTSSVPDDTYKGRESRMFEALLSHTAEADHVELYIQYENAWWAENLRDSFAFQPKIAILQLGERDTNRGRRFIGHERLNCNNYELVYVRNEKDAASSEDVRDKLNNRLYEEFNADIPRPRNYYGHSLSVGDVIVLASNFINQNAYYVDNTGFKKLPDDFLSPDNFLSRDMRVKICTDLDIRREYALYEHIIRYEIENSIEIMDKVTRDRYFAITTNYLPVFKMADRRGIVVDMDALGYEPAGVEAFSGDFLMFRAKDNERDSFGFDGWDAVKDFVYDVQTLITNYTSQELQDRANGDYGLIEYGIFSNREIQTAIAVYLQDGSAPDISQILINEKSDHISVSGHTGTWYVIDNDTIDGKRVFLLESEQHGDEAAALIVDENVNLLLDDVYNGFDDYREQISEPLREKQRLFVDMDGTLAVFKPVLKIEELYEKGYFAQLRPIPNVVQAVREVQQNHPEIEIYILSSVLSDSPYAVNEKNAWLDRYLPEISKDHRIFPSCGTDKREVVPGGIKADDYLLDDYTKNLTAWEPPARGIKLLNGINHTKGTWDQDRIRFDKSGKELANNIVAIMTGRDKIQDPAPSGSLKKPAPLPSKENDRRTENEISYC